MALFMTNEKKSLDSFELHSEKSCLCSNKVF